MVINGGVDLYQYLKSFSVSQSRLSNGRNGKCYNYFNFVKKFDPDKSV